MQVYNPTSKFCQTLGHNVRSQHIEVHLEWFVGLCLHTLMPIFLLYFSSTHTLDMILSRIFRFNQFYILFHWTIPRWPIISPISETTFHTNSWTHRTGHHDFPIMITISWQIIPNYWYLHPSKSILSDKPSSFKISNYMILPVLKYNKRIVSIFTDSYLIDFLSI